MFQAAPEMPQPWLDGSRLRRGCAVEPQSVGAVSPALPRTPLAVLNLLALCLKLCLILSAVSHSVGLRLQFASYATRW